MWSPQWTAHPEGGGDHYSVLKYTPLLLFYAVLAEVSQPVLWDRGTDLWPLPVFEMEIFLPGVEDQNIACHSPPSSIEHECPQQWRGLWNVGGGVVE